MERIEADVLIPGRGDAINGGCVIFDGPVVTYAGPLEGAPKSPAGTKTLNVPAVIPGLWDAHRHFTGLRDNTVEESVYTSDWVAFVRGARDAEKALRAGFTSVRELSGFDIYLARAVDEGSIPGPRIYASGIYLNPVGGHGEVHAYPLDFVRFAFNRLEFPSPCTGVTECIAAVRKVLRLEACVVKVVATGGVLSDRDDPAHRQFSDEEFRALREDPLKRIAALAEPETIFRVWKAGRREVERPFAAQEVRRDEESGRSEGTAGRALASRGQKRAFS